MLALRVQEKSLNWKENEMFQSFYLDLSFTWNSGKLHYPGLKDMN